MSRPGGWRRINSEEARSLPYGGESRCRFNDEVRTRCGHPIDSALVTFAAATGHSASYALSAECRRLAALQICAGLTCYTWVPSARNPAGAPSSWFGARARAAGLAAWQPCGRRKERQLSAAKWQQLRSCTSAALVAEPLALRSQARGEPPAQLSRFSSSLCRRTWARGRQQEKPWRWLEACLASGRLAACVCALGPPPVDAWATIARRMAPPVRLHRLDAPTRSLGTRRRPFVASLRMVPQTQTSQWWHSSFAGSALSADSRLWSPGICADPIGWVAVATIAPWRTLARSDGRR